MNIPELKKAMEMVKGVLEDDQSGCGCSYKSDAGKAINTLLSSCQLLCDVSDKMEPKKEHSKWEDEYEKGCIEGSNERRSEDILWIAKKMMGLEDKITKNLLPFADGEWRKDFPDNWKWDEDTLKRLSKMIANAIRKEMGI